MDDNKPLGNLIDILNTVIHIIKSSETDVAWSSYKTVEEAVIDLTDHIDRLAQNDLSRRWDLTVLFAPTGPLQEISLHSGWEKQFLELAAQFDAAMRNIG